jgi:hypothetical protein
MNRTFATAGIVLACLSAAVGCQPATSATTAAGTAAQQPALHVVLRWERVSDGKFIRRQDYAVHVQNCKAAGWPVQELAPDEIQKLDTGTVEIWRDARGAYGRQTSWNWKLLDQDGPGCKIKLEETVDEEERDDRDLDWSEVAIGPAEQEEEEAFARQQRGFERVGPAQVKGQPCTRWRSKHHEECVWSGGLGIGISDAPTDSLCITLGPMAYLKGLPLESKQGRQGRGCNLELETMSVGKGLLPEVGRAMAELDASAKGD